MDFLLQRCCPPAQVRLALETYFRRVGQRGPEPLVKHVDFDAVACKGDVAWKVSVYYHEAHEEALARFLARTLHTKVVISDDSSNPYTWVLVDEQGVVQPLLEKPVEREGEDYFFAVDERYRHLLAPCPAAQPTEGK